jgi:hypothetical protein
MWYESSVVYFAKIPKVVIDSGFDWATFFSFMATIAVFSLGTWLTINTSSKNAAQQKEIFKDTIEAQEKSLRLTHKSQEDIARSNAVKVSRQAWIDQLRDACSEYLSLLLIIAGHEGEKDSKLDFGQKLVAGNEVAFGAQLVMEWLRIRNELRSKIFQLKYKIELLSNPKEELFKTLLEQVNEGVACCETMAPKELVKLCEQMKSTTQEILKIEWDRTKNML